MSDKELAELVRAWLRKHGNREKAFSRNIMGKTLKAELLRLDHWKNAKRGNVRKAYQRMIETQEFT